MSGERPMPSACPFCGSESYVHEDQTRNGGVALQVQCADHDGCGASSRFFYVAAAEVKDVRLISPGVYGSNPDKAPARARAVAWWNRRAPWPTLPELPGDGDIPEML
jgi:hypothetical protein